MAKKKTTFVLIAKHVSMWQKVILKSPNGVRIGSFRVLPWNRKAKIFLKPGESQKVRFTVEKVED